MSELTVVDLVEILRSCAGQDESVDLESDDVLDTPFGDLGYDSLALLQATGEIERLHNVTLADETVGEANTPRKYLDLVNASIRQAV
ncbi:acyl carrier protein [Streptomyces sp. I05A-00742]|uniref:acyl carrier protein n=1 Tax=Streptomyces sp. I05A-00742 TaxID=2732853 RepID=UPI0014893DA0|nr:acyl carrier protein [Streptomyces sp. I05A-00742]